jgi:hypothetical protein
MISPTGMGGAIRFGMRHPDVFGSVYAMHPVGTGQVSGSVRKYPNGIFWRMPNPWMT